MRIRPLQSLALALLLLTILAPQFACTIIGAAAGGVADASNARTIPTGQAVTVRHGKRITFLLRDGNRLVGVFRDTTRLDDAAYTALWQRWLATAGHVTSVAPGDTVTLVDGSGEWHATFTGYHYRSLEVVTTQGELKRVPMESLRRLRGPDQREWDGTTLEALDAAGAFPSRMAIVMDVDAQGHGISSIGTTRRLVSMSEIQSIALEAGHSNLIVGTLIGLTADILVIASSWNERHSLYWGCSHQFRANWPFGYAAPPAGLGLSEQPYDRFAGRFISAPSGRLNESHRAAPAH